MLNKVFKSVSTGEIIKVVEYYEKSKQCIVELENGKTRAYSSATLKDKRKFTPVELDSPETVEPLLDLDNPVTEEEAEALGMIGGDEALEQAVVVPEPERELTDEEYAAIGLEIAEQAKIKAEQAKAKKSVRKSLRLKEVTYKGETKSIREWAEETGMPWKTLYNRINNNGWPVDLAIETPIGERKPKEV